MLTAPRAGRRRRCGRLGGVIARVTVVRGKG
jgi:hypothetical protein